DRDDHARFDGWPPGENLDPSEIELLPGDESGARAVEVARAAADRDDVLVEPAAMRRLRDDSDRTVRQREATGTIEETIDLRHRRTPHQKHRRLSAAAARSDRPSLLRSFRRLRTGGRRRHLSLEPQVDDDVAVVLVVVRGVEYQHRATAGG